MTTQILLSYGVRDSGFAPRNAFNLTRGEWNPFGRHTAIRLFHYQSMTFLVILARKFLIEQDDISKIRPNDLLFEEEQRILN